MWDENDGETKTYSEAAETESSRAALQSLRLLPVTLQPIRQLITIPYLLGVECGEGENVGLSDSGVPRMGQPTM